MDDPLYQSSDLNPTLTKIGSVLEPVRYLNVIRLSYFSLTSSPGQSTATVLSRSTAFSTGRSNHITDLSTHPSRWARETGPT